MLIHSLIAIVLTSAFIAGARSLRVAAPEGPDAGRTRRRIPRATLVLVIVIATSTVLQMLNPALLLLLRRDGVLIQAGQWWRLVTSVLVQDGGAAGGAFNILSLLLAGGVAEFQWGTRRWGVIAAIGGLLAQAVALTWQPTGAGSSIVTFSLAGAVCVAALARCRVRSAVVPASLALGGAGILCLLHDIHGPAAMFGAGLGLSFIGIDRFRDRRRLASHAWPVTSDRK